MDLPELLFRLRQALGRDDAFQTAWCHGAPGIGLARLRSLPVLDDAATRAELRAAIATTLAHGFTGSHCLCHGGFGNLELLVRAHEVGLLDDAAVLERALGAAAKN